MSSWHDLDVTLPGELSSTDLKSGKTGGPNRLLACTAYLNSKSHRTASDSSNNAI